MRNWFLLFIQFLSKQNYFFRIWHKVSGSFLEFYRCLWAKNLTLKANIFAIHSIERDTGEKEVEFVIKIIDVAQSWTKCSKENIAGTKCIECKLRGKNVREVTHSNGNNDLWTKTSGWLFVADWKNLNKSLFRAQFLCGLNERLSEVSFFHFVPAIKFLDPKSSSKTFFFQKNAFDANGENKKTKRDKCFLWFFTQSWAGAFCGKKHCCSCDSCRWRTRESFFLVRHLIQTTKSQKFGKNAKVRTAYQRWWR